MSSAQLHEWRKRLGLTQAEAAKLMETPLGTYRRWEQGTRRLPGIVAVVTRLLEAHRP